MKQFTHVVKDPVGIHARLAGLLVKEVKDYASNVTVEFNGRSVTALKIMAVMSLGVNGGDEVTLKVEGPDEDTAVVKLKDFFEKEV